MGMVELSCGISRFRPGIIMAEAEGDQLNLIEEWFEKKSRQAAIFSAGKQDCNLHKLPTASSRAISWLW
jgi:hypothetical protein